MRKLFIGCWLTIFASGCLTGTWLRLTSTAVYVPWRYWLGNTLLGSLVTFVGLSLGMVIVIDPQFVIELHLLTHRNALTKRGLRFECVFWFIAGLCLVMMGILIILISIKACPAF